MKSYMLELPETIYVALLVLTNYYGVDDQRVKMLTEEGYDANKVQSCVNELVDMIERYS